MSALDGFWIGIVAASTAWAFFLQPDTVDLQKKADDCYIKGQRAVFRDAATIECIGDERWDGD